MKRVFAALLVLISLFSLIGCSKISIDYDGNATLKFCGKREGDSTELTKTLTEEETYTVKTFLSSAEHSSGVGCPFDENISITFGDQVFAIAYDDCPSIWLVGSDKYYTLSKEGTAYIVSLFEEYVGYFP